MQQSRCLTKPITLRAVLTADPAETQTLHPETFRAINLERLDDLRDGLGVPGLSRMFDRYTSDFANLQDRLHVA